MPTQLVIESHTGDTLATLTISKVVRPASPQPQFMLDQLPDGTYKLTCDQVFFGPVDQIESIDVFGLSKGRPRGNKGVYVDFNSALPASIDLPVLNAVGFQNRLYIHIERGTNARWRMHYSDRLITDITKVKRFVFRHPS